MYVIDIMYKIETCNDYLFIYLFICLFIPIFFLLRDYLFII